MNPQTSYPAPPPAYAWALRAALNPNHSGVEAFNRWQTLVNVDDLPAGQFPLLPLIGRNLERQGINHPWLPRLKGVYRKIWYSNQLSLRALAEALATLQEADIPALVVGSAALALTVYPESALRLVFAPEIVIPVNFVAGAVARLQAAGWQPNPPHPTPNSPEQLAWRPGRQFTNASGQRLQLWWHPLPAAALDTALWGRAMPLTVENVTIQTLDPTDHMLWVCQQAAWHTPLGLADAALLMRRHAIEWSRLLATAQEYRLGLFTVYCLSVLVETLHSPIPPETLAALRQIPARPYEQRAHRAFLTPPTERSLAQRFWLHYAHYRRAAEFGRLPVSPVSWGRYLRYIRQSRPVAWPSGQKNLSNRSHHYA